MTGSTPKRGAQQDSPEVSVIVPVHNEVDNIARLVAEIVAALEGGEAFEIIYVNDGSTDQTPQRLRQVASDEPRLRIFHHHRACGQSAAVRTGVRQARGRIVVTIDGDGQNDPADFPNLLAAFRDAGGDDAILVAGQRTRRMDVWIKRISSRFARWIRLVFLNDPTPDSGCGLKVMTRTAFLDMPFFDHMHRFLPALMVRQGGRVISIPVGHRPRQEGVSKYGTLDRLMVGIFDLLGVIWLKRRARLPQVSCESTEDTKVENSAEDAQP